MLESHVLFRHFADHGIVFSDEVAAIRHGLSSDIVACLEREFKRRRSLTPYQLGEIRGGRGSRLLIGEHIIRDEIGKGAQAVVYKAYNIGLGRTEAVKLFFKELLEDRRESNRQRILDRIQQGVRAAARLAHENIVTTYHFDRRENYVAMEYVDGPDLDVILRMKELTVDVAIDYVLQIARALDYAHKRGVIHRDIKPRNLLFDERSGQVKVTDWGLARILHLGSEFSHFLSTLGTCEDEVFGTPGFMAPEQAEAACAADERSDIYSVGCTLYTLLTRKLIYEQPTCTLTMLAHGDPNVPIPSLRGVRGTDIELDDVFRTMVAKRPEARFQTMRQVIEALEGCRVATSLAAAG